MRFFFFHFFFVTTLSLLLLPFFLHWNQVRSEGFLDSPGLAQVTWLGALGRAKETRAKNGYRTTPSDHFHFIFFCPRFPNISILTYTSHSVTRRVSTIENESRSCRRHVSFVIHRSIPGILCAFPSFRFHSVSCSASQYRRKKMITIPSHRAIQNERPVPQMAPSLCKRGAQGRE